MCYPILNIGDSMKGKSLGSYFNQDITERINFEYLRGIVSNKHRLSNRDRIELKICKVNNRKKVIQCSIERSNKIINAILGHK